MDNTTIGQLIKRLRESRGLTQGQLATYAGVTRSWLSRVEIDQIAKPEREMLEAVARVLQVPANTLLSVAGYRVAPLPPPDEPDVDDLLRRTRVQFQKVRPIRIPYVQQSAAAGYLGGAPAEIEMDYWPEPQHRRHKLLAIHVSGTCLEPRLMDGHTAIVDRNIDAKEGDIVLALHEGEAILKEYRMLDGVLHLVALQGQPPIRVNSETRIVGVVVDAKYKP